jgi:hypothetical protein
MRLLAVLALALLCAGPAAAKPAKPAPAKIAPATLASYKKHLRAGRKLGDQKKWGEAVVELEAALRDLPLDGRALSELGWAAFAAGDYEKARKANAESVRVAGDLKVKAASLYNLGRVAEASGDANAAVKAYALSLTYRPGNKIVVAALAKAQKSAPAARPITEAPCADAHGNLAHVCKCLVAEQSSDATGEDAPSCAASGEKVPDPFQIASVTVPADHEVYQYLLAQHADGLHVVAALDSVYNPGMFGVSEEWSVGSAEIERYGDRKVLVLHEKHDHVDNDRGVNEVETSSDDDVTYCVLGAGKTPTTCPLQIPLTHEYTREVLLDDADDTEKHEGLPAHDGYTLDVTVLPTGAVTVKLQKGAADDRVQAVLGPHKLW